MKRFGIIVRGRVQGVGFRFFTRDVADVFKMTGWVRNCMDGSVEMEVQGDESMIDYFCDKIKAGPALANVKEVQINEIPVLNDECEFSIRN
jgi:acylphosphatase